MTVTRSWLGRNVAMLAILFASVGVHVIHPLIECGPVPVCPDVSHGCAAGGPESSSNRGELRFWADTPSRALSRSADCPICSFLRLFSSDWPGTHSFSLQSVSSLEMPIPPGRVPTRQFNWRTASERGPPRPVNLAT